MRRVEAGSRWLDISLYVTKVSKLCPCDSNANLTTTDPRQFSFQCSSPVKVVTDKPCCMVLPLSAPSGLKANWSSTLARPSGITRPLRNETFKSNRGRSVFINCTGMCCYSEAIHNCSILQWHTAYIYRQIPSILDHYSSFFTTCLQP